MTRRELLRRGSLFLGGALLGGALLPRLSARPPAETPGGGLPSVEDPGHPIAQARKTMAEGKAVTTRVTDRHFMISGVGGNVGVYVGGEAMIVIDTGSGLPPASESLRTALRAISDKPVRYAVNTHWHYDHTDGNRNLHALGATLVSQNTVRTRLATAQPNRLLGGTFPPAPAEALPTITFERGLELYVGGEPAKLTHLALAHTDGDAYVYWPEANVLQTGDLFFSGWYPFIDGSSGGSLEGMIVAEEHLLTFVNAETRIIPGHGPLSTRDDLVAALEMLRTVRQRLHKLQAADRSMEQAVGDKPFADLDETWGHGFLSSDDFLRLLYSLGRAAAPTS